MLRPSLLAALVAASGCAPIYVPASVHVPLLDKSGDVHLAANGGTNGVQAHAAYAITDSIAVRGSVQGFVYGEESTADRGSVVSIGGGPSVYFGGGPTEDGSFPTGLRGSVSLELHGGRSEGFGRVRITSENARNNYSGPWLKPMLQADVGFEHQYFAFGLAGRLVGFQYWYDAASDFPGEVMQLGSLEPYAFVRLGTGTVKVDLQAGLVLPFYAAGEATIPIPFGFSGGFVFDF